MTIKISVLADNLNLYGLMLKPVQRFPQFLLVLQDLLNNTSFDHVDRVNIESAVTTLDKLTEQLDQRREYQVSYSLISSKIKVHCFMVVSHDSWASRWVIAHPSDLIISTTSGLGLTGSESMIIPHKKFSDIYHRFF